MKSSGGKGSGENVFYEFEILCFISSSHVMKSAKDRTKERFVYQDDVLIERLFST
jgi:hypothetical protein